MPDPATNLVNLPEYTNANQIYLTWTAPVFDGGSPIIDYRIWSDNGTGDTFNVLVESTNQLENFIAQGTQGLTYKFKV